jgi:membrane protease YdiL (CAAX protease family)
MGLLKKSKSINHKGHKVFSQRSQRAEILIFTFVYFVPSLCSLWLKKTFSTPPCIYFIIFKCSKINKMSDKLSRFNLYGKSPLYQIFVSLLIIMGVGFTLLVILIPAGMLVFGANITMLENPSGAINDNDFAFLRYLLLMQDISLFAIPSVIILVLMKSESSAGLAELRIPKLSEVVLVVILAFCIFPVTSFTGQINSAMHLPAWLSGVEHWMIEKEDTANNLIDSLITSNTFLIMMLNLLIIALAPAIAEEFIFRGVFQKIFYSLFRSGHLAIWFTAILFSALHFQFFGFIPRFILGLVFGYLFLWSGSLWLPVISHFVNNAFPVILAYAGGMEKLNAPIDVSLWKQAIGLPLPVIIGLVILYYFKNKSDDKIKLIGSP